MRKRDLQKEARVAAEAIMVDLAETLSPMIKRLTTRQLADVLGMIQLGWLRGYSTATTEHADSLRETVKGVTFGGRLRK